MPLKFSTVHNDDIFAVTYGQNGRRCRRSLFTKRLSLFLFLSLSLCLFLPLSLFLSLTAGLIGARADFLRVVERAAHQPTKTPHCSVYGVFWVRPTATSPLTKAAAESASSLPPHCGARDAHRETRSSRVTDGQTARKNSPQDVMSAIGISYQTRGRNRAIPVARLRTHR